MIYGHIFTQNVFTLPLPISYILTPLVPLPCIIYDYSFLHTSSASSQHQNMIADKSCQDGRAWALDRRELCSLRLVRHGRTSECENDPWQVLWVSNSFRRHNWDTFDWLASGMPAIVSSTSRLQLPLPRPSLSMALWFQIRAAHSSLTGLLVVV